MAYPHALYNNPPAYMGFVGFVRFRPNAFNSSNPEGYIIRARTAEMNVKQEITKPDIIDSRYDRTVYQLGPKEVDGTIEFPAVYDAQGGANICEILYKHAVGRTPQGLLWDFPVEVKYAASATYPNESEFTYTGCIVNSWNFSVAKQDTVNIRVELIGLAREYTSLATPLATGTSAGYSTAAGSNMVGNTRAVTWNDARAEIVRDVANNGRGGFDVIQSQYMRNFECTINNNANRFYTLNGQLFAQSVAPTKRDIMGRFVLMGRHKDLAALAWDNEKFASESTLIRFGFTPKSGSGASAVAGFGCQLPNCVFAIEEMSLTNDIFETTVNWHSLPSACDLYDYLFTFDRANMQYSI